jgi:hypothetical protein
MPITRFGGICLFIPRGGAFIYFKFSKHNTDNRHNFCNTAKIQYRLGLTTPCFVGDLPQQNIYRNARVVIEIKISFV